MKSPRSRRRAFRILAAAAGALTAAVSGLPAGAAESAPAVRFAPSQPVAGSGGGTEPRAAVLPNGRRLVTWQGGDPVSASDDGSTWKVATGGHDSSKCAGELFDAGDVDVAVSRDGKHVFVSSLVFNESDGVGVGLTTSADGGSTWSIANCRAGEPASDRPFIAAGAGPDDVVLYEKDLHLETPVVRVSHDGGHTFGPLSPVLTDPRLQAYAAQTYVGSFAVARDGTIYAPVLLPDPVDEAPGAATSQGFPVTRVVVAVGHEDARTGLVVFVDHQVSPAPLHAPSLANAAYIFPALTLDAADHPVVTWSQATTYSGRYDVMISSCATGCSDPIAELNPVAAIWSPPVAVTSHGNNVFPLVAAGAPGRLALAFYHTPYEGDTTGGRVAGTLGGPLSALGPGPDQAQWRTFAATATDWVPGSATPPHFQLTDVSGHTIHTGPICLGGSFCDLIGVGVCGTAGVGCGDRAMADNFGLAVDPEGGLLVAWTDYSARDSHGNPVGQIFAACQSAGPSLTLRRNLDGCMRVRPAPR